MTADLATRVAAERAAQGLPPHVEDEAVLDRIVALLGESSEGGDGRGAT